MACGQDTCCFDDVYRLKCYPRARIWLAVTASPSACWHRRGPWRKRFGVRITTPRLLCRKLASDHRREFSPSTVTIPRRWSDKLDGARADLAEDNAAILVAERDWNGITPPLATITAIAMAQVAEIASEVTRREVRHTVVTDDEWQNARVAAGGMPAFYAEMLRNVPSGTTRRLRCYGSELGGIAWPATAHKAWRALGDGRSKLELQDNSIDYSFWHPSCILV